MRLAPRLPERRRCATLAQNAVHAMLSFDSLAAAVRETLLAGGDSGARACFIGACFGAAEPRHTDASWVRRTCFDVGAEAAKLVGGRGF
eukprot:SAG11_NODE_2525_length_3255_cov_1.657795_2_plen_89_part_00